jgi:acetyl esterase/lipase
MIANMRQVSVTLMLTIILSLLSIEGFPGKLKVYIWQIENEQSSRMKSYLKIIVPETCNKTRIGVIICPGGSYAHMMGYKREGEDVGEWFAKQGITAFVLRYRVAENGYHHPAMIEDFQKSIDYVRKHASEFDLDTNRIGAVGFSAGGHLALMSGVFSQDNYLNKIGVKTSSNLRPSFIVAIYPVVSMQDSLAHQRSRKNLLGKKFTKEQVNLFSLENQDLSGMPPVFISVCRDDKVVNCKNSIYLYNSLQDYHIPSELLIFEHGNHGYGIDAAKGGDAANWNLKMMDWLKEIQILN